MDEDPIVQARAASEWCVWQSALVSVDPNAKPAPLRLNPKFQLAFSRIVTHYFRHAAWLDEGALIQDAGVLSKTPGILVHGRLDLGGPLITAWELSRAWPGSKLHVVDGAGHSTGDPGMTEAVIGAIDRFS